MMDWDEYDEADVQMSGSIFYKFPVGTTRLRVASKPYKVKIHWIEDSVGARKKYNCCDTADCPICLREGEVKQRWYVAAIVKTKDEERIQLIDLGPQIFGQLIGLHKNPDWPSIYDFDVRINRKKSGTPLYTVTPIPTQQGPLSELQIKAVDEFLKKVKIEKIVAAPSVEELKKKLSGTNEGEEAFDDFSEKEEESDSEDDELDKLKEDIDDSEENEEASDDEFVEL